MKYKISQLIMVWLLPLIVIGGIFYPILGYLVVAMMAFFLTLAFFKGRYWCWHLCPRGAFLDIVVSKMSPDKPFPKIFTNITFRWFIFFVFMGFVVYRLIGTGGSLILIGSVFVGTCILTTVISLIMGVLTKHRSWCAICPMGTLQERIGRLAKKD